MKNTENLQNASSALVCFQNNKRTKGEKGETNGQGGKKQSDDAGGVTTQTSV